MPAEPLGDGPPFFGLAESTIWAANKALALVPSGRFSPCESTGMLLSSSSPAAARITYPLCGPAPSFSGHQQESRPETPPGTLRMSGANPPCLGVRRMSSSPSSSSPDRLKRTHTVGIDRQNSGGRLEIPLCRNYALGPKHHYAEPTGPMVHGSGLGNSQLVERNQSIVSA